MDSGQKSVSIAMSNVVLLSSTGRKKFTTRSEYSTDDANPLGALRADPSPLAMLCVKCQSVFEGEWAEKESLNLTTEDNASLLNINPVKESPVLESNSSMSDSQETESSEWGENPEWVKVVPSDTEPVSFVSPQHHSVENLKASAQNGCNLCALLRETVIAKMESLDLEESVITSLVGIVVVRPSSANSRHEGTLVLEVSFFVDAKVEGRAYKLAIEVLLIPYRGEVLSPAIFFFVHSLV